ncbi:MAG: hypothetical protein [Olavius algarvensis Delta 4 endosymbiont]|nr:MAG: hypothetical protein [Olavius algarvensis Delta 4 endosymbiont]
MNKIECFSIKISSRMLGLVFLVFSLLLAFIGAVMVPIVGLFFALPFLFFAGFLLFAPESKTCKLISAKTSR